MLKSGMTCLPDFLTTPPPSFAGVPPSLASPDGFMKVTMGVGMGLGLRGPMVAVGAAVVVVVVAVVGGMKFSSQGGVGAVWVEGGAG